MPNHDQEKTIFYNTYFSIYESLIASTHVDSQLIAFRDLCLDVKSKNKKLILAGNGASASISSQAATDFSQHAGVRALALNDHNLITAFGNDYGYENWILRGIELYSDPGDLIVLISSSGNSQNVLRAADYCRSHGLKCVTFTGFSPDNSLRGKGDLSIWADCNLYNIVETAHLFWILTVVHLLEFDDKEGRYIGEAREAFLSYLDGGGHIQSLVKAEQICRDVQQRGSKILFLGNGGSSSIASHAATDFTKQGKVRSVAFNDHNLLTCYANDYGHANWMAQALKAYSDSGDVVVLISTSGESENLLRAADYVREASLEAISFSSFRQDNPLNRLGFLSFWIPSTSTCVSQSLHSALLLSVCDSLARLPLVIPEDVNLIG